MNKHNQSNDTSPTASSELRGHLEIVTIFMSGLLVFTIIFEVFASIIHRKFKHKPHVMSIISTIYKELTILGLVSLILYELKKTSLFDNVAEYLSKIFDLTEKETEEIFESVHMLLFGLSMIYLLTCVYLFVLHILVSRQWKSSEELSQEQMFELLHKKKRARRRISFYINKFKEFLSYRNAEPYVKMRISVTGEYNLDQTFDFAHYISLGMRDLTEQLLDVHLIVWLIILAMIWLNFVRFKWIINLKEHTSEGPIAFVIFGAFLLLLFFLLHIHCHRVKKQVLSLEVIQKYCQKDSFLVQSDSGAMIQTTENQHVHGESKEQDKLFLLKSPYLVIHITQTLLLLEAWYTGLSIYYSYSSDWVLIFLLLIFPFIFFVFLCPALFINLTLILFTGLKVNTDYVKQVLKHDLKRKYVVQAEVEDYNVVNFE